MSSPGFSSFHPLIRQWFRERLGFPTDIQAQAWTAIARGEHVLVTAPTGCGKTLAAFLWGLHQLITGAWPAGQVRVLYVSPLKALNNDIQRNVLRPLAELTQVFRTAGAGFPDISVSTRSGDTPGEERRKMARRPPEILITTPESLNLLLTSRSGRSLLTGIATVILDEIHAVAGTKRGTHLITAVDRLVLLSGEFQRIALSATVNPPGRIADFFGGYRLEGRGAGSRYEKRPVTVIRSALEKAYEIKVSFPPAAEGSRWPSLISSFKQVIAAHRSTLLFTNSRRTAEKVSRLINEGEREVIAYAHHGSLAREIRLTVEQKLKSGELRAIVATNSLELGIDIGSLDRVILIQTPRRVSAAVQRVGRSGHDVGEKSRATIFPTHGRDLLDAAVMARAILEQDIEEVRPADAPLDILAQIILSMTAMERWDIDELYAFIRSSYPYRTLSRRQFDSILEMLNGRYADSRVRELKGRVSLDRIDNSIQAHTEIPYLLYTSGGTIPERGYFALRVKDTHARIGELDEEFVWERSIGETFSFGSQLWRIEAITHNDVEVIPVSASQGIFPFWRAEDQHRDFHLSERIALFLERADRMIGSPDFPRELKDLHFMDEPAVEELISFLKRQKEATGRALPHRRHLLIEHIEDQSGGGAPKQLLLHTVWGGRVNAPFALALSDAWEEKEGRPLQIIMDDYALLLMLPRSAAVSDLLGLITSLDVEAHLRKKLEQSGFFGARFRENAERALLLPKPGFKRRMPLWLIRHRAKELFAAVRDYGDFPILLETWRTCLKDEFDLENLHKVLDELREGTIRVSETITRTASPFTGNLVWKQTNQYVYEDDTPPPQKGAATRPDLVREVLFSSSLRPKIPAGLIRVLSAKLKRTAPGYSPASALELVDWIKDRLVMPEPEWTELSRAISRDHDADAREWIRASAKKIAWISWPGLRQPLLSGLESLSRVLVAFRLHPDDVVLEPVSPDQNAGALKRLAASHLVRKYAVPPEEYDLSVFLTEWLSFTGPVRKEEVQDLLGIPSERLEEALESLIRDQDVVLDFFTEEGRSLEICDSENLAMLLRMNRRRRQPAFEALPLDQLPLFLARYQGVAPRGSSLDDLRARLEQLFGWPAPAGAWEEHLLPARISHYRNEWLDGLLNSSDVIWFGCGQRRISLAFRQDLELFLANPKRGDADGEELEHLIPDRRGRYSFFEIAEFSRLDTVHASELLWKEAWKGNVTSDTFGTVRKGLLTGFRPRTFPEETGPGSRRSGFDRWRVSRPVEGHWLRIDNGRRGHDPLAEEELNKDRVRQLLKRYGVLFRELLANELPPLQWRSLFRSLRLMELSGEVLSGYFFRGISGPQFSSPEAFQILQDGLPDDVLFWINATDPASLCGAGIEPGRLPSRVPSTHLVYHGSRLVMISKRTGKALEVLVPPEDPRLEEYLVLFREMLVREFNPLSKVTVEMINGEPAIHGPYTAALKQFGFRASRNNLELWKQYS